MQLEDLDSEKLKLTIQNIIEVSTATPSFVFLIAHTRQVLKIGETGILQQGKATFSIDKKLLGDGISHLTIFNADKQPVCERLFFKNPAKKLKIDIHPDKNEYSTREKINIDLTTQNSAGDAEAAHMSMSVYLLDSLQTIEQQGIESYLWLTSDLKGNIESPDYYFSNPNPEAIDNLMLTHGWRKFNWEKVLKTNTLSFAYIPEYNGHIIRGKVIDSLTNRAVSGANAFLSSPGKYVRVYNSKSDATGNVNFEMKNFFGPREIIAQASSITNRIYKLEFLTPFAESSTIGNVTDFDFKESLEKKLLSRSVNMQTQNIYFEQKEADLFTDTTAFYGTPDAVYDLDKYTRFTTLEDVFREYVPTVDVKKRKGSYSFKVINMLKKYAFEEAPLVLLDGVPIANTDSIMAFDPLKIKRLDVVYQKYFLGSHIYSGIVSFKTYKGDLGNFRLNHNLLVLDYEGLQKRTEFYAPKYETQKEIESKLPDFRNLLYWNASLKTGVDGKQKLSFFSSDKPGKHIIVTHGLTSKGLSGSQYATFEVKARK